MDRPYGYALLTCDAIAHDPNGKLTLYGLFDRIWSARFPTVHPMFAIFWRCVAPGPGRVAVTIQQPDGSTLLELEPVETNKEHPHAMQGTYTLGSVQFPREGAYTILLTHNSVEALRTTLHLQQQG